MEDAGDRAGRSRDQRRVGRPTGHGTQPLSAAHEIAAGSRFIERTVSVLNRKMLGFEILAEVEIKVLQIASRSVDEEFRRAVGREPSIIACYVIAGQYDFLLKVVAPSIDAYAE